MPLRKRIEAIKSVKEAKQMAGDLAYEVASQAMGQWEKVCDEAERQCVQLFKPFQEEVTASTTLLEPGQPAMDDELRVQLTANGGWWTQVKNARGDIMLASMLGGVGIGVISLFFPPAALFLAPLFASAPLVGLAAGWKKAGETEVERGKQQLRQNLTEIMDAVRRSFLEVNQTANQYSHVDEYFENRKSALAELVDQIAQQKSVDHQEYIKALGHGDGLTDEQRKSALQAVQQELAAWIASGIALKEAIVELDALQLSAKESVASANQTK
jgi:hypothetical protein